MKSSDLNPTTHVASVPKLDKALLGALGFLCLAAILCFLFVDDELSRWIARRHLPWTKYRWPMGFRQLGKAWAAIWLLCLGFWVTRRSRGMLCAILALLLTLPLVLPLKGLVGRARPGQAIAAMKMVRNPNPKRLRPTPFATAWP